MEKVLLINPYGTEQDGFTNPPTGLLYLAGMLEKNGFQVKVLDCCIEGKNALNQMLEKFQPTIVGVTCLTPERKKALEVAKAAKDFDPKIKTVLGGAHATIMPKQILENYPYVDYVVVGEGEITFLEIVQRKEPSKITGLAYRNGEKIVINPPRKYVENLDDIPFPAWHLIDIKRYPARGNGTVNGIDLSKTPRVSVIFSRGCKGHCNFCSSWWIWKEYRHRSPKNMVDEMELLYNKYGVRHFCFADDALTVDMAATSDLCDEIIKRNLKIAILACTRTDCVNDPLLQKMKAAGCYEISYGIETGSPLLLNKMLKENDIETSRKAIAMTKKAGIHATALMIVGNVGETDETVKQTVDFLRETEPNEIGIVGGLWVLPGTKLHTDCKNWGFITNDFWLTDNSWKLFTLEQTPEQLKKWKDEVINYNSKVRLKRQFFTLKAKLRKLGHRISLAVLHPRKAIAILKSRAAN